MKEKTLEALLIGKLPNFTLNVGKWGLDDLISSLVGKAFPILFDLDLIRPDSAIVRIVILTI